jgi:phospho-N-acetylmuramoyl-pentapeptide-transferase
VSAGVALILALLGTPLAIRAFSRRGYGQLIKEDGPAPHATKRRTPTMGGAVIVVASLIGYIVGHILTSDPMTVSGILVLGLMTGLGVVGFVDDFVKIHRNSSLKLRGRAKLAHGLDGLATGSAILVLTAYVLIANWQLRNDCTVLLTKNCYFARDPLDLAAVAAAVLGACFGFLGWNAPRARILMGDTGSLALGGVLAGLAITTHAQLLLAAVGGLFAIIAVSVMRRWADRLPIWPWRS